MMDCKCPNCDASKENLWLDEMHFVHGCRKCAWVGRIDGFNYGLTSEEETTILQVVGDIVIFLIFLAIICCGAVVIFDVIIGLCEYLKK